MTTDRYFRGHGLMVNNNVMAHDYYYVMGKHVELQHIKG